MNDEFLYKNRPPVRKAFADRLFQRLSSGQAERPLIRHTFAWKGALPALLLLAVLAVTIFEPVRARALEWIRIVAGFTVEERSESPLKNMDMSEVTIYEIPTLTVTELLENPPFEFGMPAWAPDGFVMNPDAAVANSESWVSLNWRNTSDRWGLLEIEMLVEREYTGYNIPTGEDSSEEITINGQPALLIRGSWDGQHEWDPGRAITLGWAKDGRHYRLIYTERLPATQFAKPIEGEVDAIIEDLVRMAESIP